MRQFFVPLAVVLIDKRFYGGTNCPILIPFYEVRLGVVPGSVPYCFFFVLGGQMLELRASELGTIIRDYILGHSKDKKNAFYKIGLIEHETALFSAKRSENLVNQSLQADNYCVYGKGAVVPLNLWQLSATETVHFFLGP